MKIENIALGDFVQVKKSMCHSEFKAKQLCEVIDIDLTDKHGFDVLIQGKNCLDWVNHKDLKKYIERDLAKELLEVDLSSELTGSDLTRAMLERGDRVVLCAVGTPESVNNGSYYRAITEFRLADNTFTDDGREIHLKDVTPINNQGEPLTAADVGL